MSANGCPAKRSEVLRHDTAECFSDVERAAVGIALAAGEVPNGATQAHFDALKEHYTPRQIAQITGRCGSPLLGF